MCVRAVVFSGQKHADLFIRWYWFLFDWTQNDGAGIRLVPAHIP